VSRGGKLDSRIRNLDNLRGYHYNNVPIGKMIFSAISSKYGHTSLNFEKIKSEAYYYFNYLSKLESTLISNLRIVKPDLVVTINDRLPGSAMSVAVARQLGIKTKVFYWGSDINRIVGYDNSLYDFDEWREMIKKKSETLEISLVEKTKLIEKIDLFASTPSSDSETYLHFQKKGKGVSDKRKIIVFYAASEHEHSPLIYRNRIKFSSQYDAFNFLQKICKKKNYLLILKYHPLRKTQISVNSNKLKFVDWEKITIYDSVVQLLPDSDIDTYQLLIDADINVTWSSTVGLESIAREKKTIIMGDATWLNLDWGIHAWDENSLEKLLENTLPSLKRDVLLPWFWFMQDYGEHFKFVTTLNFRPQVDGTKIIQPRIYFSPLYNTIMLIKKFINIGISKYFLKSI
jgi:hypothetical protein